MSDLHVVILAAGKGTRMYSDKPKVLHAIGGKPMLEHVIDTAERLQPARIHVVVGHGKDLVIQQMAHKNVGWVKAGAAGHRARIEIRIAAHSRHGADAGIVWRRAAD